MKPIVFISLLFFCTIHIKCKESPTEPSLSVDDAIREVVFRNELTHDIQTSVVFLSLIQLDSTGNTAGKSDPSQDLMVRFKDNNPPVKRYSQSRFDSSRYVDIETGKQGVLLFAYPLQWQSTTNVQVDVGVYDAPLNGMGSRYFLHKESYNWIIDSLRVLWVS